MTDNLSNAAGRTSQFAGALTVQMCSDSKHSYKMWKSKTSQCGRTTQQRFMEV